MMLRTKLVSNEIYKINYTNKKYFLYNSPIYYVEVVGIVLETKGKYLKVLDFYGEIDIFKDSSPILGNKRYIFKCNLFFKDNKVMLYCTEYLRVDIYKEIFFHLEKLSLSRLAYDNH